MVALPVPSPAPSRWAALAAWRRERLRGRVAVLTLVVLFHLVVLLLVLFARGPQRAVEPPPTVVRMIPLPPPAAAKAAPKPKAVTHPNAVRIPKPIVIVPKQDHTPPALFKTEMMDAVDISKLPSHKGEQTADGAGGQGQGADTGTAYGPGAGPGGARLYNAEWYREPTHAELATYLPRDVPLGAWADIACRTAEHFAVEDCQELGDSPAGSHLARAIREAAWQFKVRPPRVGGQVQIGAWVRIHIAFTKDGNAPAQ